MMGLVMTLFTDPNVLNRHLFTVNHSYGPDYFFSATVAAVTLLL